MIHYDCRYYVGRKPCKFKRACDGCPHFNKVEQRILVIKLGALGDLLRTTCIIPSLKAQYPKAQITWITTQSCVPLLENLSEIDRIWVTDGNLSARVIAEEFDLMINFDKDTPAVEMATIAKAKVKKGFGLSPLGSIVALNSGSQYALDLGLDDELKFRINQKTYQQIIHEMADLPVQGRVPNYQLRLTDAEKKFGEDWLAENAAKFSDQVILGINPGAGDVFATKKWHTERYIFLIMKLYKEYGVIPMLLGGKSEEGMIAKMEVYLKSKKIKLLRPGENLKLREFVSLIAQTDGLVSGDTLAMHISLAVGVPAITLFLSTCAQEIETYGLGRKLIGQAPCAPCYLSACKQPSQYCANNISVEDVFKNVVEHLQLRKREKNRRYSNV